jgi:hypothetical protein
VRWQASSNGLSTGIGFRSIRAFVIDPRSTSRVFAATDTGVYLSEDGGAGWHFVFGFVINALVMDPGDPDTLYAGYGAFPVLSGGLSRSTQSGAAATWKSIGSGIRNISIVSLAASPASNAVYAGRLSGGIERTTDRGLTWQRVLGSGGIIVMAIDPSQPDTVYTGSFGFGVNKTTNGGVNWPPVNTGLTSSSSGVAIDPAATATVYAGIAGAIGVRRLSRRPTARRPGRPLPRG